MSPEIPEDIASNVIDAVSGCSCDDCLDKASKIIACAIMAERERCAQIAENSQLEPDEDEEAGDDQWLSRTAANARSRTVAHLIRSHPKKLPAGDA